MRACYICTTPYQLFNSMIHLNSYGTKSDKADLILFFDSGIRSISMQTEENVRKSGLFCHVYAMDLTEHVKKGLFYKPVKLLHFILSFFHFERLLKKRYKLADVKYDVIYCGWQMMFVKYMQMLNPGCRLMIIEEGTGTYAYQLEKEIVWEKISAFLLRKKMPGSVPDGIYVHNAHMMHDTGGITVYPLKGLHGKTETEFLKNFNQVFQTCPDGIYKRKRIIYFTQTFQSKYMESDESIYKADRAVIRCLGSYKGQMLVRMHPYHKDTGYMADFDHEDSSMWELECAESISDSHILISVCSTSLFTPKILYEKEPYLIFTYKMYEGKQIDFPYMDELTGRLSRLYKHKEKILIIQNERQLQEAVTGLLGKAGGYYG